MLVFAMLRIIYFIAKFSNNFFITTAKSVNHYSQPATAKLLICRKKTSFGVSNFSFFTVPAVDFVLLPFARLNIGLGRGCGFVKPNPQSAIKSRASKMWWLFSTKILHFVIESRKYFQEKVFESFAYLCR